MLHRHPFNSVIALYAIDSILQLFNYKIIIFQLFII